MPSPLTTNMLVIDRRAAEGDFGERGHEVAVADLALVDVGVGGAVHEQLAGELAIGAAGGRAVEAEEPLVDQVGQVGRRGAGDQVAETLAQVLALAALPSTTYSASRSTW